MKASDDLFLLIRSLSGPEKTYFIRYAGKPGGRDLHYLRLFRAIAAQKKYDESSLKKKLSKFIPATRFAFYKNYLYAELLKSLDAFYDEDTIRSKIFKQYRYYELLSERGFNDKAYRFLEKAIEMANRYELSEITLELKREILLNFPRFVRPDHLSMEELQRISGERRHTLKALLEAEFMYKLRADIYFQIRKLGANMSRVEKDWMVQLESPFRTLEEMNEEKLNFEQRALRLWMRTTWYYHLNRNEDSYKHAELRRQLFLDNPHQIREHLDRFIGSLTEQLSMASNLDQKEKFRELLRELEQLIESRKEIRRSEYHYLRYRMILAEARMADHYKRLEFRQIAELSERIRNDQVVDKALRYTESGGAYLHYQARNLIFYLASYLITGSNSRAAIFFLNKFPSDFRSDMSEFPFYARILLIIAHFELQHFDIASKFASEFLVFMEANRKDLKFERWLLECIIRVCRTKRKQDRRQAWRSIESELSAFSPDFKPAFVFFDCKDWISANAQGSPVSEILRVRWSID